MLDVEKVVHTDAEDIEEDTEDMREGEMVQTTVDVNTEHDSLDVEEVDIEAEDTEEDREEMREGEMVEKTIDVDTEHDALDVKEEYVDAGYTAGGDTEEVREGKTLENLEVETKSESTDEGARFLLAEGSSWKRTRWRRNDQRMEYGRRRKRR